MYERSYGYRYDEAKSLTVTEIAALIRADVKTAVSEGLLPSRWKYSVRTEHGTGIGITVTGCPDAWTPCDGSCRDPWCKAKNDPTRAEHAREHLTLTEEGEVAAMTLKRIHNAYNHDGSEIMVDYFDVRYYGGVTFEDPDTAAWRASEKARMAAKKAAREGGTVSGKVANFSGRGRPVVHVLIETTDGKAALACGARVRGSMLSKVNDESTVTCSRCAAKVAVHA